MSEQEKFIIDTNCFIAPYNQYYSFVFESEFWNELVKHIKAGNIILIKSVRDEILTNDDALSDWIKSTKIIALSDRNSENIIKNYGLIMNYLNNSPDFSDKAKKEWLSSKIADPWVIATAMDQNSTIVTFEGKVNSNKKQQINRAKIPNIAEHFDIKVADLFYMMRTLKFKL